MTRDQKPTTADLARLATLMHAGAPALEHRLDEMGGGFPSAGDGGRGNSAEGGPTATQALAHLHGGRTDDDGRALPGTTDVAVKERAEWERDLLRAIVAAEALWDRYVRLVQPRRGLVEMAEPTCELCDQVPDHSCTRYASVEVVTPARSKREKDTVRRLVLCSWCYQWQRPDRAGRLPNTGEVTAHAEGRRVRWPGAGRITA